MTVAQRLYLLIFAAVVGMASLAGLGMVQMDKVYTAASYANINTVPSLLTLDEAFKATAQIRVQVWAHMTLSDRAKKDEMVQKMNAEHAKVIEALDKYEKEDVSDGKDKALLVADRSALDAYDTLRAKVLALSDADKTEEARDLFLSNQ